MDYRFFSKDCSKLFKTLSASILFHFHLSNFQQINKLTSSDSTIPSPPIIINLIKTHRKADCFLSHL